jgi:hypothetical protein
VAEKKEKAEKQKSSFPSDWPTHRFAQDSRPFITIFGFLDFWISGFSPGLTD